MEIDKMLPELFFRRIPLDIINTFTFFNVYCYGWFTIKKTMIVINISAG